MAVEESGGTAKADAGSPPDQLSLVLDLQAEDQPGVAIYAVIVFRDRGKHCPIEMDCNGAFKILVSLLPQFP